jgi:histidinol phosphatase-like PHP family hydrolase
MRQHAEIDALNAEYGADFRILKGTECGIPERWPA